MYHCLIGSAVIDFLSLIGLAIWIICAHVTSFNDVPMYQMAWITTVFYASTMALRALLSIITLVGEKIIRRSSNEDQNTVYY